MSHHESSPGCVRVPLVERREAIRLRLEVEALLPDAASPGAAGMPAQTRCLPGPRRFSFSQSIHPRTFFLRGVLFSTRAYFFYAQRVVFLRARVLFLRARTFSTRTSTFFYAPRVLFLRPRVLFLKSTPP